MKRYLTLIVLLLSCLLAACGTNAPTLAVMETPSADITGPTLDRCSPVNLTAEIVRVNKLTDEFDRYSSRASESRQSQLIRVIPDLQRILRDAQDQDVPACLLTLKELQTAHMDAMTQALIYLYGQPLSAASPNPSVVANVNSAIAQTRDLHEKYDAELSRLLDIALVTPASPANTITTMDQPTTMPYRIVIAAILAFAAVVALLGIILEFMSYHQIKRTKRNHEMVLNDGKKQVGIDGKRLHDIYKLTSMLSSASNYRRAFELALDISVFALNRDTDPTVNDPLAGMAVLFEGGNLCIGQPAGADMRVDNMNAILKRMPDEKEEVILFKDMEIDPQSDRAATLCNYKSGYSIPIRSDLNIYGILLFVHPHENYFTADHHSILKLLGSQLSAAIENIHLYQGLTDEKEHVIVAYEEARRELAHKVHAGPIQTIADMAIRLNTTKHILKRDVKAGIEEIARLEELAQSAIQEIGHMPVILRPLTLESQGLAATLQVMADQMKEIYNQRVIFNVDGDISNQFELDKQNLIFHIIEEAVGNACKHAAAEIIAIRLHRTDDKVATLQIVDNGIGFDIDTIAPQDKRTLHLVNLRERAKLIQGLLQVDSIPGQGTIVQVYIPFPEVAVPPITPSSNSMAGDISPITRRRYPAALTTSTTAKSPG